MFDYSEKISIEESEKDIVVISNVKYQGKIRSACFSFQFPISHDDLMAHIDKLEKRMKKFCPMYIQKKLRKTVLKNVA